MDGSARGIVRTTRFLEELEKFFFLKQKTAYDISACHVDSDMCIRYSPGIVLDETDAVLKGQWQYSTHTPPYLGIGYLHDQKSDKGEKSVTWAPIFPKAGKYEVRVSHCYNVRRSSTTPVTIIHASGKTTIRINQQKVPKHGKLFRSLGVFEFKKGKAGSVTISNEGTEGKYVIADAVQFLANSAKGEAPKL